MRRALSLAALGSTLLMASAASTPLLTYSSIKALNSPSLDKDSWSFKGTVTGVDSTYLDALFADGIDLELYSPVGVLLDIVTFDADECKSTRKGTGASCRTDGARFTVTEATDKTDDSTYYKISGGVHRREFDEDTLATPLSVALTGQGGSLENDLDCTEKEGAKGQLRATCKP